MIRKHLHHFNRGLVIGFEALGLAALALFVAWLFLVIRLSRGPLDVDFLTRSIEQSFNSQQRGFNFSVGSTALTWGGTGQPFVFEMKHVQVVREDKTPVLSVEKIGVQLSKRHLVFGEFVPRIIRIYGPALRIVHGDDGHFTLNINDNDAAAASTAPAAPSAGSAADKVGQMDFIKALLAQMNDTKKSGLLGGLEEVSITDAALLYEDKIINVSWKSRKADVDFIRGHGILSINSLVNIEQDPTHVATLRGNFNYSWQSQTPEGIVVFTNFNPSLVAQQSQTLKVFSGVDMPLKGSISVTLDPDFNLGNGRFVVGSDPGKLSLASLYAEPISVDKFYVQGQFNAPTGEMTLDKVMADIGGPRISASASVAQQSAGHIITVNATLEAMPIDKLKIYWPASLTPDPRAWVTEHLSAGTATKATLDLAMLSPHACAAACGKPWDDFGPAQVQKLGGQIDFSGIKVNYFPPLMPVTKVNGKANYDQKSFNLALTGGTLGDMQVTGSKIAITGLDIQDNKTHSKIDIAASLKGPLKTALTVLDGAPLEYPKKLGIETGGVAGDATVDVNFKFPLYKGLTLDDLGVTAKAQLNNVLLKGMVADLPLSGGPMDLSLSSGALGVKGKGMLGTMPVTFDWLKNFSSSATIASKVEASLPLDAAALSSFGVPDNLKVSGNIPATVTYIVTNNHTASLLFKGDITPAGFTLPVSGYNKPPQAPGKLEMSLHLKNGLLSEITDLNLGTADAQIKGEVNFTSDGKTLKSASFNQVKLGNTDVAFAVDGRGSDGYDVKVTGAQFDASGILSGSDTPNSDEEAAKKPPPLNISMAVDRLVTGKEKYISKLKLFMRRNSWSRIDQLQVDGVSGGQPVVLRYMPVAKGHTLSFEADNAGAALSVLGISKGVRGGKVVVNGAPNQDAGERDMHGTVVMTDFSVVDMPVLGRLLNGLSLSGFIELLNGKGIAFKKMRSDFVWIDRGQPNTAKNVRLISLKNGQTSGASLGLTFEGNIDNWKNTLDMSGTIIPVSDLNKMLSVIPLVGDILTGGGKGVFAATYTGKGPKDKPDVSVNPLSVLAPGILRKLFFEH